MALTAGAGAAAQHTILLWPFPHFAIAIAGAQVSYSLGRYGVRVMVPALLVMAASNGLLVNQYYADLATRGTTVIWTDAVYPLFSYLDSIKGHRIITLDWGYAATLCLLSDGEMPLQDISYKLLGPSDTERNWIRSLVSDPKNLFVDHVESAQQFAGVRERLASIATQAGYSREVVTTIADRNHRPRFEIVRYTAGQ